MPTSVGKTDVYKVSLGDLHTISKISIGDVVVYSAGTTVTYYVDTNAVYQEEVDVDETVLSPKTFTPTKAGWEFVGWRLDSVASGDVLSKLDMGDDTIILYGAFQQSITLSYDGNGSDEGSTAAETQQRYYNNGAVSNPQFTVKENGFEKENYSFVNWRDASGQIYNPGDLITISENNVLYAEWETIAHPYTIVEHVSDYPYDPGKARYRASWEFMYKDNISTSLVNWVDNSNASVTGVKIDSTKNGTFYAQSNEFPTNGCKKVIIRIANFRQQAEGTMQVNNTTLKLQNAGGALYIFDISNSDKFQIKLNNLIAYAYNGNPFVDFYSISVE